MEKAVPFLFAGALLLFAKAATAQPVTLDVHFKLTDLDYKPLAGVPVRIVFALDKNWQDAAAGAKATTDANGEAKIVANVALEKVRKKVPTNFAGSLLSGSQPADHVTAAVELPSIGYRWLYVVDLFRFEGGDVMLDDMSIYTRDPKGNFTLKAKEDSAGWHMPELGGLVLTSALYEPRNYTLEPVQGKPNEWTLQLSFKKSPDPVRR